MNSFARRAIRFAICMSLLAGPAFAGTVYGDVVTDKGQPYPTKISFTDDTGKVETVTTDAKGHYEITLPPGRYRVESDTKTASPATIVVFHEPRQQKIVVAEAR